MTAASPLLLASASPRRAALLRAAGIPFRVLAYPAVDEAAIAAAGLAPEMAVEALARLKLRAARAPDPDALVLAADTLVHLDGRALGKPLDSQDAALMLRSLSGRAHLVVTGLALGGPGGRTGRREESASARAVVRFRTLTAREIEAYVATGEPLDKAGGYGIQGAAGAFVAGLDGEVDTVVGLPIGLLRSLLARWPQRGLQSGSGDSGTASDAAGR